MGQGTEKSRNRLIAGGFLYILPFAFDDDRLERLDGNSAATLPKDGQLIKEEAQWVLS
jgi:hypothetical protein